MQGIMTIVSCTAMTPFFVLLFRINVFLAFLLYYSTQGNIAFREIVDSMKDEYCTTTQDNGKISIARKVVEIVHRRGGRFVEKCEETGCYVQVPIERAMTKTCQCLREKRRTAAIKDRKLRKNSVMTKNLHSTKTSVKGAPSASATVAKSSANENKTSTFVPSMLPFAIASCQSKQSSLDMRPPGVVYHPSNCICGKKTGSDAGASKEIPSFSSSLDKQLEYSAARLVSPTSSIEEEYASIPFLTATSADSESSYFSTLEELELELKSIHAQALRMDISAVEDQVFPTRKEVNNDSLLVKDGIDYEPLELQKVDAFSQLPMEDQLCFLQLFS
jgi:hypothetical protein